uniref:Uncharacterized protein n=1 Tax=Chromera velia CCMP2878 TaxID=1169474 RepID=A0A0G4FUY5_9ALVE|eukprot:Cvel_18765.t1-p1 / transcript=Cvel_18765.t1 / gene=Cvel_18765 / organism=Chromera_velia_CCMP2878 / gene_product=hypothetical protein / transcript_product=hypothetical protein / location=Cvel_scaffold1574:37315-37806(-) / protein_length=164 / sequence_SO=supercontig / SO=protein_coding / is_pseudo=false
MELYRVVRGYVPQNWVDFLCEQPSMEIVELSVPRPLFQCGDYVLACLVAVLRYDLGEWESMFHQTDDQPHVILAGRGWIAIRLRGQLAIVMSEVAGTWGGKPPEGGYEVTRSGARKIARRWMCGPGLGRAKQRGQGILTRGNTLGHRSVRSGDIGVLCWGWTPP